MKRKVINVSEETHTQFFSIRNLLRVQLKTNINADFALKKLISSYHQSKITPLLDKVTEGMYQLEEKQ